ncbi:hypothetical protein [Archangium sp.]|uniref:hypothetical protein n=1 Tax=Archangium sp. TaxID=1872627 RepID=UPI003899C139
MEPRPSRLGVGLSYQGPLRDFVREHLEDFDFLEVVPDIFWTEHPEREGARRFEENREAVRFLDWVAQARALGPAEPPLEGEAWYEAHPRLTPWCRIVPFRREPLGVLRELSAGRLPPEAPEGEYTLVLESVAPGRVAQHSMDALRGRLLRASTGERSVSHLCAGLDCLPALVRELAGRGFLQVTPGG